VREAAWCCEWVGVPAPFVRCISFVIAMANKELTLTAGKFVPVSKVTMVNVRYYFTFVQSLTWRLLKFLFLSVCVKYGETSERIFMEYDVTYL
jgi:hypothetical protein